jgi:hypothetical protein
VPLPTITQSTVTITIATPAVVSWTAHGLTAGTAIDFVTTGALPAGLAVAGSANSIFYVSSAGLNTNDLQVSTTRANADAGTSLATSGSQSGTHTCAKITGLMPWDVPNVAVTFNAASPNITWAAHGLELWDTLSFTATTFPTAMLPGMNYWVSSIVDANTITISQSYGDSPITWAGAGSGVYAWEFADNKLGGQSVTIATVVLAAHVNLAFTNLIPGSLIYVVARAGGDAYHPAGTHLIDPTIVAGTSYSQSLTLYADQPFTCVITNSAGGYEPILFDDICTTANGFSRLVQQRLDS